jgi:hypothetical protein
MLNRLRRAARIPPARPPARADVLDPEALELALAAVSDEPEQLEQGRPSRWLGANVELSPQLGLTRRPRVALWTASRATPS